MAVENKKVVGHILFTKVYIKKFEELALAPLSVLPEYQRNGIGLALIKKGHSIAKKSGYDYSIVLGNAEYYAKAGYVPASIYGIKAPFNIANENFMAIKLNDTAKKLNGIVRYDTAFGIN